MKKFKGMIFSLCFVLILTIVLSLSAYADTAILQDGASYSGTRDTYMYSWHNTLNFGSYTFLRSSPGQGFTPIIKFAIFQSEGGPVPDGATIQSATLSLYKDSYYSATFKAYRLLKDWKENEATWNRAKIGLNWASGGAYGSGTDIAATADGQFTAGFNPGVWVNINVKPSVNAFAVGTPK